MKKNLKKKIEKKFEKSLKKNLKKKIEKKFEKIFFFWKFLDEKTFWKNFYIGILRYKYFT